MRSMVEGTMGQAPPISLSYSARAMLCRPRLFEPFIAIGKAPPRMLFPCRHRVTCVTPILSGDAAQRLQRAQIAVGSSSPRASSRTASSPASTVPGRSAKACFSNSPIASADMRTA